MKIGATSQKNMDMANKIQLRQHQHLCSIHLFHINNILKVSFYLIQTSLNAIAPFKREYIALHWRQKRDLDLFNSIKR